LTKGQESLSSTPGESEERRIQAATGSPFLWLLSFGEAKESNSPSGARPRFNQPSRQRHLITMTQSVGTAFPRRSVGTGSVGTVYRYTHLDVGRSKPVRAPARTGVSGAPIAGNAHPCYRRADLFRPTSEPFRHSCQITVLNRHVYNYERRSVGTIKHYLRTTRQHRTSRPPPRPIRTLYRKFLLVGLFIVRMAQ